MPFIKSCVPFTVENPFRSERPASDKIIFLSMEGSSTEEEYITRISELFDGIKSKIKLISVAEDEAHTEAKYRTPEQVALLTKNRPKQLLERIEWFKKEQEEKYQFSKYPEDEFWIVTDVDQNWSDIKLRDGKTYLEEWEETIALCDARGYKYAVSNPFFEIWLLLHHDDPTDEDKTFAVTDDHPYSPTDHFRKRLRNLGYPLKDKKHITFSDYDVLKVKTAVRRAQSLHIDKQELCPKYFATTVYLLIQKILEMLPSASFPTP